jgi:peptidoglycan lytic transglycosylase D
VPAQGVPAAQPTLSAPDLVGAGAAGVGDHSIFRHNEPKRVPPFPLVLNQAVRQYVESFLDQSRLVEASFNNVAPYLPEMTKELERQGLPKDLVYLAFAESGFSKVGAGPWQLTRSTARLYGLRINKWVDERRDPVKSTRAAAEFLADLHDEVGDWRITLASWNTGEAGIDRFWALRGADYDRILKHVPRRTGILLNRFMAAAFIARNAETYGLEPIEFYESPIERIKVRGGTRLTRIAQVTGTSVQALHGLNPAILRDRVPPYAQTYEVWVPRDTQAGTEYSELLSEPAPPVHHAKRRSHATSRRAHHSSKTVHHAAPEQASSAAVGPS